MKKYTERQLDRLVDEINDERKDRDLLAKRLPVKPKPAPSRRMRENAWPFMEQRPNND